MVKNTERTNKYKRNQFRSVTLKCIVLNGSVESIRSKIYHKIKYHKMEICRKQHSSN